MTPLAQADVDLIRDSFGAVLSRRDAAGRFFYAELFRIAPDLKPMFGGAVDDLGRKLIDTLALAVYALRSPGGPAPILRNLGRGHATRYGVLPAHFEPVGRALAATLGDCLGPQFAGETRDAWLRFYKAMADEMIAAGETAADA
jgi:hemoglobin-like flavoprotein